MYKIVLQWQLCAHFITCFNLVLIIIAAGLRPRKNVQCKFAWAFYLIITYLLVQIILFGFSFNTLSSITPKEANLSILVIDHIWTPMGTSFVIWLFLAHVLQANDAIKMITPRTRVASSINASILARFVSIGICSMILLDATLGLANIVTESYLMIICLFGLAGIMAELLYHRVKYNYVPMLSGTWAWFIGTWLGVWILAIM